MQFTKKLSNIGGSKVLILPKLWLDKFPGVTEVLIDADDKLTVTPIYNSVTANLRAKTEALQ